jgi:hypothetical protein
MDQSTPVSRSLLKWKTQGLIDLGPANRCRNKKNLIDTSKFSQLVLILYDNCITKFNFIQNEKTHMLPCAILNFCNTINNVLCSVVITIY